VQRAALSLRPALSKRARLARALQYDDEAAIWRENAPMTIILFAKEIQILVFTSVPDQNSISVSAALSGLVCQPGFITDARGWES
jgi:hypothetical protein